MSRKLFLLESFGRYADWGLLLLRVQAGAFLVYGVQDNVLSTDRMEEFSFFLAENRFPVPDIMAPVSVYLQFICGVTLTIGVLTRWTGIIIAVHFIVALIMVHWAQDFRGWWPAIVLVGIGLQYTLTGAGRFSVDALLARNED